MKRAIYASVVPVIAFTIAIVGSVSAAPVQAQTSCPVGFTCTAIDTVPGCPAGFICVPTTETPVSTGGGGGGSSTGVTTTPTPSSCYTFTTNLTIGSSGADVVSLQTLLLASGYDIAAISSGRQSKGVYSYQTAAAVARYQASVGIPATGFVGPLTRGKLNAISCTPTTIGTPTTPTIFPVTPGYASVTAASATLGTPVSSNGAVSSYPLSFTFTITAGNSPLYFGTSVGTATFASIGFAAKNGNISPSKGTVTAYPYSLAGDSNVSSGNGYYVIPAGSSRQFTFSGSVSNSDASVNGLNIAQIIAIQYGTSPSNLLSNSITSGLSDLKLLVTFTGITPTAPTTPTYPTDSSNAPNPQTQSDYKVAFKKTFNVSNTSSPITLTLSADNQYSVAINGVNRSVLTGDTAFTASHQVDITSAVHAGSNDLVITVTNQGVPGSTWSTNPAGLSYSITQNGSLIAASDSSDMVMTAYGTRNAATLSYWWIGWPSISGAQWIWDNDFATSSHTYPLTPAHFATFAPSYNNVLTPTPVTPGVPTISSISPTYGSGSNGETVTLTGSGFTSNNGLYLTIGNSTLYYGVSGSYSGPTSASPYFVSPTQISFRLPTLNSGNYSAMVSYNGTMSNSASFTVNPTNMPPASLSSVDSVYSNAPSGDWYSNPVLVSGGRQLKPANDVASATKWCQLVSGKYYTYGVPSVSYNAPQDDYRYSWNGSQWIRAIQGDYVNMYQCSGNNAPVAVSATVSLDASSPMSGAIQLPSSGSVPVTVLVFDVKAQGAALSMKTLSVAFSGSAAPSTAYLYQGSQLIASAPVAMGINKLANFADFNVSLPADTYIPLNIKVDVSNTGSSASNISASVNSSGITIKDANGSSVTPTGSAQGNTMNLVPQASASAAVSNTSAALGSGIMGSVGGSSVTTGYNIAFSFNLTAGSNTLFISSNPAVVLGISNTGSASVSLPVEGVISNPGSLSGDTNTSSNNGYYVIPAGASRQFTYNGALNSTGLGSPLKVVSINQINYGTVTSNLSSNSITSGLESLRLSATLISSTQTQSNTAAVWDSVNKAVQQWYIDHQ